MCGKLYRVPEEILKALIEGRARIVRMRLKFGKYRIITRR